MAYKSIFTAITDLADVGPVLESAIPFVAAEGAHLEVLCLGIDRTQTGYYFAGATSLMLEETLQHAQSEAREIEEAVRERLGRSDISWGVEAVVAQTATVAGLVARHARFADVVLLPKPYGESRTMDAPVVVEAAMFQGQTPVVVLPGTETPSDKPSKVVIAWNESAEALAAVRLALPLIVAADEVDILIIEPQTHAADTTDPGSLLSTMLSRHGAKVKVTILPRSLPRVSDVILRYLKDENADLLVMGAYGHSRFREAILGGATRNLLELAEIPVFMAH